MFLKRNEQRHAHPYLTLTVGTLTVIGAASVIRCAKNAMRYGRDKVSCIFKGVVGNEKNDMCGE